MSGIVVMGRAGADLYPNELRTPLSQVRTYTRFAGGFAANVATGLARLGVPVAIVSRVGDDGHGEFVRAFLAAEGVDVGFLGTDPVHRTPLTFCEVWPPDDFPLLYYREPTAPDWEIVPEDFDAAAVAAAPVLMATGTGLARAPSRATTLGALHAHRGTTVFDLDWRPMLWTDESEFPGLAREAIEAADIVVGNEAEVAAAGLAPDEMLAAGVRAVVVKRGSRGTALHEDGAVLDVPAYPVQVVNGLGAGDAFAAALGHGILAGMDLADAVRRGNVAGALVAAELSCSEAMPRLEELEATCA